jgi:sugar lactone lactonase YvrE
LAILLAASASPQDEAGFLWVAHSRGLLNIATDEALVRFDAPSEEGFAAVAVNDLNGDVWALQFPDLIALDRFGRLKIRSDVSHVAWPGGLPTDMVVDGTSGNLWLAAGATLYRFDLQGNPVSERSFPYTGVQHPALLQQALDAISQRHKGQGFPIVALTLDRPLGQLWVALPYGIVVLDADGNLVADPIIAVNSDAIAYPRGQAPKRILDAAYDRSLGEVWVSLGDALIRFDVGGSRTFEKSGGFGDLLSADGSGGLWFARRQNQGPAPANELVRIDGSGEERVRVVPFRHDVGPPGSTCPPQCSVPRTATEIVDVVADAADGSVWAATAAELRHFSHHDGALIAVVSPEVTAASALQGPDRKLLRAALYADLDPPEVQFTKPAADSVLNTAYPPLELSYFDLGVGVEQANITVNVDDVPLAATCSTSPTAASCVPDSPLSEGRRALTATVADAVGNVSEPATRIVQIDTVPPTITVSEPMDGSHTNLGSVTIAGSLSEPAALTINDAGVSLSSANAFSREITLVEGPNAIRLVATDVAGNSASAARSVTLDSHAPPSPQLQLISMTLTDGGMALVTGQAGSVEAGSIVRITNLRTGVTISVTASSNGSFTASITASGNDGLSLAATDRAGNTGGAVQGHIPGALTFSEPPEAAVVERDAVLVAGTLLADLNAVVLVNGTPATMALEGGTLRFYANVPLQMGENTITAVATLQNGSAITARRTVSRQSGPFSVTASPTLGNASLRVTYSISEPQPADALYKVQVDSNGDGEPDASNTASGGGSTSMLQTFATPGVHRPVVDVLRWNPSMGQYAVIYQQVLTIVVTSATQQQQFQKQVLQSIWTSTRNAFASSDVNRALTAFSSASRSTYGSVMNALLDYLPEIAGDLSHIEPLEVTDRQASCLVMTNQSGARGTFVISFVKDRSGLWRIDSM